MSRWNRTPNDVLTDIAAPEQARTRTRKKAPRRRLFDVRETEKGAPAAPCPPQALSRLITTTTSGFLPISPCAV